MSRGFSRTDARRSFIMLGILAIAGICYWFILPTVQSLVIPAVPGGRNGPWLVRPILAFHFGAVAVMATVTVPFLTRPLRKLWSQEDASLGTRYDPFHDQTAGRFLFVIKGSLLLVVYALGLIFYMFSWSTIGPDGIEERLPWKTRKHPFRDIVWLEMIPKGERSESIRQNGPWYSVQFRGGRYMTLSGDNEGCGPDELRAITAYIAERSQLKWERRRDARAR